MPMKDQLEREKSRFYGIECLQYCPVFPEWHLQWKPDGACVDGSHSPSGSHSLDINWQIPFDPVLTVIFWKSVESTPYLQLGPKLPCWQTHSQPPFPLRHCPRLLHPPQGEHSGLQKCIPFDSVDEYLKNAGMSHADMERIVLRPLTCPFVPYAL